MLNLIRRKWRLVALTVLVLLFLFYFGLSFIIGHQVRAVVHQARTTERGDALMVLLAVVASPQQSLNDRNRAVWALGQLGDPRALPALEKLWTGEPCDHENALCQHELEKAVKLCRGGYNMGAWIWRSGVE